MLAGAASMAAMGLGIVIAKPILERTPLTWATTVRLLAGAAALAPFVMSSSRAAEFRAVFRPGRVWLSALPASVLGGYVSLLLWVAGFKYTTAAIAGILNQTTVIFAIVLASVLLREPFTRRKLAAVTLALAGVGLVTLGPAWLGS